jgi:hypothetical protein
MAVAWKITELIHLLRHCMQWLQKNGKTKLPVRQEDCKDMFESLKWPVGGSPCSPDICWIKLSHLQNKLVRDKETFFWA